jgi:4-hydroxy-tetrahydrodipicolinate reductase
MSLIKVGICGASGKMGKALIRAVQANEKMQVFGALEHFKNPNLGRDAGVVANIEPLGIKIISDAKIFFENCDAVIDFSFAGAAIENITNASKYNCTYVLGTTGLEEEQVMQIKGLSKTIPIMCSANMSIGVNIALHYSEQLAKSLDEEYDIEIHEMHHKDKLDSPSGTALALGKAVAKGRGINLEEKIIKPRWGIEKPRKKGDIGFSSQRGGDVIGDHTVTFAGNGERIEIGHKASNRDIFANGAVRALLWLHNKSAGYYSMKDVLGLN